MIKFDYSMIKNNSDKYNLTNRYRPNINKSIIKKIFWIILFIFIGLNTFIYTVEYKNHVLNAPQHLQEANKDYIIAKIISNYYAFSIKTFKLRTNNILLYPLSKPMMYFYQQGLNKLELDEPIRVSWFNEFELLMYNYSNNGKYGSLAKNYGHKYSKKFIDDLYYNIELFNQSKKKINTYYSLGYKNELTTTLLQNFLNFIQVYVNDYHLNQNGFPLNTENLEKVSNSTDLYERFENIGRWNDEFVEYYKIYYPKEYDAIMNPKRGWYSDYRDYYLNMLKVSSYILFYKINQDIFDCHMDKNHLIKIDNAKKTLRNFVVEYKVSSDNKDLLERVIRYLHIKNLSSQDLQISENPLNLRINCIYKQREN
ncbi:hypothetical protein [Arcobacter sp. FWKO B]|uniref:hypothetical protein n=1 Tax=Arcobacter sp. FWKO B TaxID=2593672 RepID=UPI0018A5F6F0|nr:hypothetical protein [Arcobacter sp. FWKO B]QOG11165.1 hypothetical protein FWKOB_00020 [Arcobacter sp. FWKO B]